MRLVLSPSPRLAALILALHAAAAIAVLLVARGPLAIVLAALFVLLGAAAARRRALLRSPASVRALELGADSLVLERASGERIAASRPARCYVSRLAVALPLRGTLLVAADMLPPADFRRLRLWALWGGAPAVAGKQLPA